MTDYDDQYRRMQPHTPTPSNRRHHRVVSRVFPDGRLLELVSDGAETAFIIGQGRDWQRVGQYGDGTRILYPYRANNNLLQCGVVLLPERPASYDSQTTLVAAIRAFIHRYCDLPEPFEHLAAYYVLFSWVHDAFAEVPYLRVLGDYGSGKTRFLLTVGSLCYKPIFASGASTTSPIFHLLHAFGGTLILDEGDFRYSDETADLTKILNQGTVRGVPVLRTAVSKDGEFSPRAFRVFGPKIVATRHRYRDRALESRFLTQVLGTGSMREDIPINLSTEHRTEAQHLRNQLLQYRLNCRATTRLDPSLADAACEPRLNQVFVPLLSVVADTELRRELAALRRTYHGDIVADRGESRQAHVLAAIRTLRVDEPMHVKDVAAAYNERYGTRFGPVTPRLIGEVLRRDLMLVTQRTHTGYVIPVSQQDRLVRLYPKYGIQ